MKHGIRDEARAAVCFLNADTRNTFGSRQTEAFAMLSIFHPKLSLKKRLEFATSIARKGMGLEK